MTRLLLVDNYDSFTHNLAAGLHLGGADVTVVRNDAIDRDGVATLGPDGIVLSPGPGHPGVPRDFGVCTDLVRRPLDVPMLGVCLGMQGMVHHTGGRVIAAPELVHGEASDAELEDHPLFDGVARRTPVGRYHSLCVDADLPPAWSPIGTSGTVVMAVAHQDRPWVGVQFHPESILTPQGPRMLQNFVEMCR